MRKPTTNFISPENSPSQNKNVQKRKVGKFFKTIQRYRFVFYVVVIFIFLASFLVIRNYAAAQSFYENALSGKRNFELAQESIEKQDFTEATLHLRQARADFTSAQTHLRSLKGVKFIPLLIRQINALDHLLTAGIQASAATEKVTGIADLMLKETVRPRNTNINEISTEQRRAVLKILYESLPTLQGARADIGLAVESMNQIPEIGILGTITRAVRPLKEKLPMVQSVIDQIVPLTQALPQIVGYPDEKHYLFLLQNNTELRPTGGFIGTYGILKLHNGDISTFSTDNVYNLDEPFKDVRKTPTPWPFEKYVGISTWFFRDCNWSPDFSETAKTCIQFYREEDGPEAEIDGVIAITPTFIESLLRLVGNIEVDGIVFTADNFTEVLQEQVELKYQSKGLSQSERKEIIGDLADVLISRILSLPKERWKDLWKTVETDFSEKHIIMYFVNEELQNLVKNQKWDGGVYESDGDYVLVVDTNLASLKSDPGVKRVITYALEVNRGSEAIGKVSIHYNNEGTFSWKSTRYRTYVRVYVPQGSELLDVEGAMDNDKLSGARNGEAEVIDELGKTRFGAFISIEPQHEGTLIFRYRLPESLLQDIRGDQYSLLVQKQAGTIDHGLIVDLDFDRKIRAYNFSELQPEANDRYIIYKTDLREDRWFEIGF